MKKFFIVLGSIFLALIVLGAIGIAFIAIKGTALDKKSKPYADSAIPAIVTTRSEKELLDPCPGLALFRRMPERARLSNRCSNE